MTSTRNNDSFKIPGFGRNPDTGKIIIEPLPPQFFEAISNSKPGKRSAQKSCSTEKRKKLTELKPLMLTSLDFEVSEPKRPPKIRKLDIPSEKKPLRYPTRYSENSTNSKRLMLNKRQTSTRHTLFLRHKIDNSPLLNLEEVEETLMKTKSSLRGYPFKSPKTIPKKFNFTKNVPKKDVPTKKLNVMIHKKTKMISTPPAMARISEESSDSKNNSKDLVLTNSVTEIIKTVMDSERSAFKEMTDVYEKYKRIHNENMSKLAKLLETVNNPENKENVLKPINSVCKGGTPASKKKSSLRIATLKKNLVVENNVEESPKTRNALDLYNSTRLACPLLQTPKLQKEANEKFIKSAAKELSIALLDQCLLLQGTPKRH